MRALMIKIGENNQTIILIMIYIILCFILVNLSKLVSAKLLQNNKDELLMSHALLQDLSQSYILARKNDYKVMFVSNNIEDYFSIEKQRIELDIETLKNVVDYNYYTNISNMVLKWDGTTPLHYQFKVEKTNKWLSVTASSIDEGKYVLFAFKDETENIKKEELLKEQVDKANSESEFKVSFLSRMSHEIRTPMNGITGMLTLAKNEMDMSSKAGYYITQAEDVSKYLLSLINEILDMSRMQAGKLELEHRPFDFYSFESQLNTMFKANIEKKGVQFIIEYQDFDEHYFVGDELRVMQILANLVSNSYKFTEHGEIRVTFKQMLRKDKMSRIMIRVHDTGKGMSTQFLSHIFRPFEQENVDISRKYGGSGLGMAITDQLVKLMNGEIVVESIVEKGSDFTIFIPLEIAYDYVEEKEVEEVIGNTFTIENKHILLAEDNELNAEICISVLDSMGAIVTRCENGQLLLDEYHKHDRDYYDFILMDIQMPVLNGYETTIELRKENKDIPIFALTADVYVENIRHALSLGMDGHFAKPIDFDMMIIELGKYFTRRKH